MYNQNNDDPWQRGNGAFNDSGAQHSSAFKEQPINQWTNDSRKENATTYTNKHRQWFE